MKKKDMETQTIERIQRYKDALDKGLKVNSKELTETYNEVFGARLSPTTCSSCVRKRISALWKALAAELENEKNDDDNDRLHDDAQRPD